MEKEYDDWNKLKKDLSTKKSEIFFHKGDIWYASLGKNVGDEEDGKNSAFERPILIVRKFNNNIFLAVPLTSNKNKTGKYYHKLVSFSESVAILSQVRLLDSKRLLRLMGKIESEELKEIKAKIGKIV